MTNNQKIKTINNLISLLDKDLGKKNHCECKDVSFSCFQCRLAIVKSILEGWVELIKL